MLALIEEHIGEGQQCCNVAPPVVLEFVRVPEVFHCTLCVALPTERSNVTASSLLMQLLFEHQNCRFRKRGDVARSCERQVNEDGLSAFTYGWTNVWCEQVAGILGS